MPNHIVNHLKINGTIEQVNQVLEFLKGENSIVDFNKIKPMPEGLNISSSSDGTFGVHYLQYDRNPVKYAEYKKDFDRVLSWPKDRRMKAINLAKKYLANISKYGHDTWYSWSYANWGTKWNAYQC